MLFVPDVYKLKTIGRGRFTKRNPSKIPAGGARDSLNVDHDVPDRAAVRPAINRAFASRPTGTTGPMLGMYEYIATTGVGKYLFKTNTKLFETDAIDSAGWNELISGMDNGWIAQFATLGDTVFIADRTANYVTKGTSSTSLELGKSSSFGSMSGSSGGSAVGNAAGSVKYWFTDVEPNSGMETPPVAITGTSVSRTADQGVNLSGLTYSGLFTRKKIYRTKVGSQQPYFVGTLNYPTTTLADTSLDTSLTTISTVHDEFGFTSIEKPQAAEHICVHAGRVWIAYGSTLAWSRLYEGTQFENFTYSKIQVQPNDGDRITGIVSFRGSLVVFKRRSIHIVNGSTNDRQFICKPFTQRVGARCPRSIVVEDDMILFLTDNAGVYTFDMASANPVSVEIEDEVCSALDWSDAGCNLVCAGYNRFRRQYHLSVRRTGETSNTRTHVLNIRTGAWGRVEYCGNKSIPSCYAEMRNGSSVLKMYVGSSDGFAYETETTAGADGVRGGTKTGTITSSASTTKATISTATFYTTGEGLIGLNAVAVLADGTEIVRKITANDGTEVTVDAAWGATVVGATLYIGWIEAVLFMGRLDMDDAGYKVVTRLNLSWEKQTHATPMRVGYVVDGDSPPTSYKALVMNGGYRGAINVNDRFVGFSPWFRMSGTDIGFDLIMFEIPWRGLARRLPAR